MQTDEIVSRARLLDNEIKVRNSFSSHVFKPFFRCSFEMDLGEVMFVLITQPTYIPL